MRVRTTSLILIALCALATSASAEPELERLLEEQLDVDRDAQGRVDSVEFPLGRLEYDYPDADTLRVKGPDGGTILLERDSDGRPIRYVDQAGNEARSALLTGNVPGAAIPVLFMRLRSGALFGQRGQILGDQAGSFWDTLLENIADGECTPFLGPGVTADLLLSPQELAQTLADQKSYPFVDSHNLPRVAQFIGTLDNRRLRKDVLTALTCSFQRHMGLTIDMDSVQETDELLDGLHAKQGALQGCANRRHRENPGQHPHQRVEVHPGRRVRADRKVDRARRRSPDPGP